MALEKYFLRQIVSQGLSVCVLYYWFVSDEPFSKILFDLEENLKVVQSRYLLSDIS